MFISRIRQAGFTLIELIVFIVIVSVGVIGLVSSMNFGIMHSADPLQAKQFAAIAESVLSEVMRQPFTWCDPDDPADIDNGRIATKFSDCSSPQSSATVGASRDGSTGVYFNNVIDYHGWAMDDVSDPNGFRAMQGYRAQVSVVPDGGAFALSADDVLRVTVTVCRVQGGTSCAGRESFELSGYRFRYAPRI